MNAVNYLIVELEEAYNNEDIVSTGDSVIVNSTIEKVEHVNRIATVKSAPSFIILQEGDQVIVHHNIFRLRNDIKGNVAESNYHIEDNIYYVPLTEIFMFKRGDMDWQPILPFCFVEPIEKEEVEGFDLSASESTFKGRLKQKGIITFPNDDLIAQGIKKGDTVMFSKFSEYEFMIDGKIYYKMKTNDIFGVV